MASINIKSEITGSIWEILIEPGANVSIDDEIVVIESMKMEIPVMATVSGIVKEIRVKKGELVNEGDIIAVIET